MEHGPKLVHQSFPPTPKWKFGAISPFLHRLALKNLTSISPRTAKLEKSPLLSFSFTVGGGKRAINARPEKSNSVCHRRPRLGHGYAWPSGGRRNGLLVSGLSLVFLGVRIKDDSGLISRRAPTIHPVDMGGAGLLEKWFGSIWAENTGCFALS